MKAQCLPSDIISNLPSSIIQMILTFMPIRDAFRTSILSRKWRHQCANILKLEFKDKLGQEFESSNRHKLLLEIYTILLLHQCPVIEFSLCVSALRSCCEIDQIILYLSRNTYLEKFTLCLWWGHHHKLPASFFSFQKLTQLKLRKCEVLPPASFSFSGFGRLTSLFLYDVVMAKSTLLQFLSCCPLIKNFTLIESELLCTDRGCSNFVDLIQRLPLVEHLELSKSPVKVFALGVIPPKLTNAMVHLKYLGLFRLSFAKEDEFRSIILMIKSSPNIEKIKLEMPIHILWEVVPQTVEDFFDQRDHSYISLDHLRELEITSFTGMKPEMDFVKVILIKSPMLEKMRLVFRSNINFQVKIETLERLLQFPRASNRAKIIFGQ